MRQRQVCDRLIFSFREEVKLINLSGVGDTIRGAAMDFVDSATGTANRRHRETDIGAEKVGRGVEHVTNPTQSRNLPPEKTAAAGGVAARQEGDTTNDTGVPSQVQDDKTADSTSGQGTIGTSVV